MPLWVLHTLENGADKQLLRNYMHGRKMGPCQLTDDSHLNSSLRKGTRDIQIISNKQHNYHAEIPDTQSLERFFQKGEKKTKPPRMAQQEFLGLLFLENKYVVLRQEIILESNEFKILC